MSAPAQVTEAHRQIARFIGRGTVGEYPQDAEHDAQLIADSEAKALCELAMVAAASADRNVSLRLENAQVRAVFPKILAALGNGACCAPDVSVEFIKAIPNEVAEVVAQLRADAQRLKADGAATAFVNMSCRASRAETDRNNLRADLDAIKAICNEEKGRAERAEAELKEWSLLNLWGGTPEIIHNFVKGQQARIHAAQDVEAELKVSRAIVSKIWVQLGSPTYEQLKGRSIYDLIDELKAELAKERAKAADQGLTLASLCDGILGEDHADRSDQTLIRIGCGMKKELAASRYETVKAAQEGSRECIRAERAEAELHALRLVCGTTDADKFTTWVDRANARAEEAEHNCRVLIGHLNDALAELDDIRALADRRNERDHSQDTTHQIVAAIDQELDIAEAELADLKANNRFQRGHSAGYAEAKADCEAELATERARLDWLLNNIKVSHTAGK